MSAEGWAHGSAQCVRLSGNGNWPGQAMDTASVPGYLIGWRSGSRAPMEERLGHPEGIPIHQMATGRGGRHGGPSSGHGCGGDAAHRLCGRGCAGCPAGEPGCRSGAAPRQPSGYAGPARRPAAGTGRGPGRGAWPGPGRRAAVCGPDQSSRVPRVHPLLHYLARGGGGTDSHRGQCVSLGVDGVARRDPDRAGGHRLVPQLAGDARRHGRPAGERWIGRESHGAAGRPRGRRGPFGGQCRVRLGPGPLLPRPDRVRYGPVCPSGAGAADR